MAAILKQRAKGWVSSAARKMSSLLVSPPRGYRGTDTSFSWPTTPTAADSYGRLPGDPRVDELVKVKSGCFTQLHAYVEKQLR